MPAVRRSPRNSKTKSAQAPSAPPTILTDRCSDDLAQKVAQILEFFEGEVIRSREEARAAEEARVAAEKTKSDAKEAEERIRKRVQLMSSTKMILTRCHVYGCADGTDPDPWTHIPTSGRLLPASTVHQHRRDDRIWRSAQECDNVQMDLRVATTPPQDHGDDIVTSRALQTVQGNHPSPISEEVHFGMDDKGSSTTELECLQQYRHMFQSTVLSFTPSRLKFLPNHTTAAGAQPPLDLTDMRGSHSFMVHQQFMQKLLELVDAVDINGDDEAAVTRKKLILDIQEHRRYLDRLLDYEWLRQRAETTTGEVSGTSLPIVVNTMVLTP
ncbi:hypothetical protein PISMIDRAFT_25773 [Pisolithus microcarpus 441]|uniref:BAG domain-containing protein n=1 Tax=Pisolithus microcarpus 441 TaxID=765257 RepID=A0A0C9Y376_9AGAM|nr:hypothetical protein BKA83DRAFT_25773 [Pisolithus microcarpus]KIK11536.1 hypothetical protein PISMIDRAFT_25773 [Pisolithus microcarpus 441]